MNVRPALRPWLHIVSADDEPAQNQSVPRQRSKGELRQRYFELRHLVYHRRRKHLEASGAYLMAMLDYEYAPKLPRHDDQPSEAADLLVQAHHLWESAREACEDYRAALMVFKNAADDYRERGGKV